MNTDKNFTEVSKENETEPRMDTNTHGCGEGEVIDWHKEIYGAGYERIDHERFRRGKGDFWSGLNGMGAGGTLMMEWERRLGAAVDQVKPFLKLTGEAVEDIACPGSSDCGCRHHVSETRKGKLLAFCQCRGE